MSDIFRNYLIIVGALLAGAAIALALLSLVANRNVAPVWSIYRSWLWMIPLVLVCIFLGRVAVISLVTALTIGAGWEFARATRLADDRWMMGALFALFAATSATALVRDPFYDKPGWFPMFLAMPAYAIALIFMVPILRNRSRRQLRLVSLAIVAYLYIGWMFGHLAQLANSQHAEGYLLYLLFAVATNDIAAFTCGKLLGRRKLRSEISPNKTWAGALGALAVSMALPWALGFSFPADFGALQKILTGLIVGVGGQMGDLAISVVKRDLEIKDMGAVIPGHGGVLDRVDSLIFTAPLLVHMLNYFELL